MDKIQKDEIVGEFQTFYSASEEDKEFHEKIGSKHKRVYLFHGVAGTGKTSLIVALANFFNLNVCFINLKKHDPEDLSTILQNLPASSMVVYEDIRPSTFQEYNAESRQEGFPLSVFLNLLDGPTSPEGYISIITTNYLQELHDFSSELIREGRMDKEMEFKHITDEQATDMFHAITNPINQELNPESLELGKKFGRLFYEKKVKHSAVQQNLLRWKGDPKGASDHAKEWLEKTLAKEAERVNKQENMTSRGTTLASEIKEMNESRQGDESKAAGDSSVVNEGKLTNKDKLMDEGKLTDEDKLVDEGKLTDKDKLMNENKLADDNKVTDKDKLAGEGGLADDSKVVNKGQTLGLGKVKGLSDCKVWW
ncbi:hypothetical protein OCU04_012764 [Sclerotinia nivalis]|uniref:AAA+ ATPase domain-containing protein n=1 Tax=Sclerotinia nivalis TaxID=352851 RepID=A0A9X0AD34_9HELO|nr:hypothetical protein OCU04_012764 [Sclerotinia nivalis]